MLSATLEAPSVGGCAFRREEAISAGRTDEMNLALRIRSGDQSAFRELVECHQSRIFHSRPN